MTKHNAKHKWNYRILVVDDEKAIADSYVEILCPEPADNVVAMSPRSSRSAPQPQATTADYNSMDFNFQVDVAYSAQEALDKINQSIKDNDPFAMGFFDVKLGAGMDGVELVSKAFELCPDMFAVFVTAYNDRSIENIQSVVGEIKKILLS